jgi:hypothetical protein
LNWRATLAFAIEVVFKNIEIIGVDAFSALLFRSDAEKLHASQESVDGADIPLNCGGCQRPDEGPLLGDAALLAVFHNDDFFPKLGGEIGFETWNLLGSAARIAARALFELAVLGRTAKTAAVTMRIHGNSGQNHCWRHLPLKRPLLYRGSDKKFNISNSFLHEQKAVFYPRYASIYVGLGWFVVPVEGESMQMKRSSLRAVARSVLVDRGYEVRVNPGQGYLPGSRVVAEKDGKKINVAVKASKERMLSFTRRSDDDWRTLNFVDLVLAIVPAENNEGAEVLAFKKRALIADFDRAWKALQRQERAVSFKFPVFIPLDEVARKNVGHGVANLKKRSIWSVPLTPEEIQAKSSNEPDKTYIDTFIRRYAKENGLDEHRVFIGISGRAK